MFTSPHPLSRRVGKQTPAAAELQLLEDLLGSAMSRNCDTCVSHKSYSSLQLNVQSGFGAFSGTFFSLSLPRISLSRSTSKIDALVDDETQGF